MRIECETLVDRPHLAVVVLEACAALPVSVVDEDVEPGDQFELLRSITPHREVGLVCVGVDEQLDAALAVWAVTDHRRRDGRPAERSAQEIRRPLTTMQSAREISKRPFTGLWFVHAEEWHVSTNVRLQAHDEHVVRAAGVEACLGDLGRLEQVKHVIFRPTFQIGSAWRVEGVLKRHRIPSGPRSIKEARASAFTPANSPPCYGRSTSGRCDRPGPSGRGSKDRRDVRRRRSSVHPRPGAYLRNARN